MTYKRTPDAIGLIHREVATKKLGRPLTKDEVVHHIDEIKHNNHPDNLLVFQSLADHARFHAGGTLVSHEDGTYTCLSKYFDSPLQKTICHCGGGKSLGGTQCRQCHEKIQSEKSLRPSKEDLQMMVWEKPSSAIALDFGVSDRTIGKWCAYYNISKPPRGYWTKRTGAGA